MFEPFDGPRVVRVEASLDTAFDLNLDTYAGEQFDWLYDIIGIDEQPDSITFIKCRTLKRPGRGELTIPRSALAGYRVGRRSDSD